MDQHEYPPTPPDSAWQDDGLEFELIAIEEARRIHDIESMSQFDVATIVSEDQWKKLRRAKVPTDRALSGRAIDWLMALPTSLRPEQLSVDFPRIVNALADVWDDPDACQAAFDKMLGDGRRGRKGFPAAVQDELVALRNWTQLF